MSMEVRKYITAMRKVIIFKFLTDQELRHILSIADVINYKKEDKIVSEGEISPYFFAVVKGNVHVSVRQSDGKEVFICSLAEGDIFGETGIFLKMKRTANVVSTENTTILRIHRKDMLDFIKQHPETGNKILMMIIYSLMKKLRDSNQEIAFERKTDIDQGGIDSIVKDFMLEV
ncbi:MAG: Crp/Fnr family transcriptional regulator [Spirochaetia bacterium]